MSTEEEIPPAPLPGEPVPHLHSVQKPRLKPPKSPGRVRFISHELYEKMADVYLRGSRTANEIATKCGVDHKTARKAIDLGWPSKDPAWPPLKERAQLWDRMRREAAGQPANADRQEAAASWVVMKKQSLGLFLGVRSVVAKALMVLMQNVDRASATQLVPVRQVHYEEVLDAKGKVVRRIPRTLTVDVETAPSIHKMTDSLADLASALAKTSAGEIETLMAKPPAKGDDPKKWNLNEEQLKYMATHEGRLPPGVLEEMIDQG